MFVNPRIPLSGGGTVNPLHVSEEGRLFSELDEAGEGICVYPNDDSIRDLVRRVIDIVVGKAVHVTVAGNSITVDQESAENFLSRNKDRFLGIFREGMSLQEKILKLHESSRGGAGLHFVGLPKGFLEDVPTGGLEGKNIVIGLRSQFRNLLKGLELNGFKVSLLQKEIDSMSEGKFIGFERPLFFRLLVEENRDRLRKLKHKVGRPEICQLAQFLIDKIRHEKS